MDLYSHYSGKLGLICFAIWVVMLIRGRRTFNGTSSQSNNYWFVFICMLLYSVLGFLEWDSYHYYSLYNEVKSTGQRVHYEQVFVWLINTLPNSYFLFRFAVWGLASLLIILSFKRLKLNANVLAMTIPILFIANLTQTRGSLGLALITYCIVLLIQSVERKKLWPIMIAIVGLFASTFLHRSLFFLLVIFIVSILVPMNKRTFIISLVLFPVLYGFVFSYFKDFSSVEYLNSDQINVLTVYQGKTHQAANINGLIYIVFTKTMLLLLVFNMVKKYLYKKIETPKTVMSLFKCAYFFVYISFLFLRNDASNWLSERTLHAGSFALIICVTYCFDAKLINSKRTIIEKAILLGFMATSFWRQFLFRRNYWNY